MKNSCLCSEAVELLKLDSVGLIHQVNGVLKMEEIVQNAEQ